MITQVFALAFARGSIYWPHAVSPTSTQRAHLRGPNRKRRKHWHDDGVEVLSQCISLYLLVHSGWGVQTNVEVNIAFHV